MSMIVMMLMLNVCCFCNMICNGDLQNYTMVNSYQDSGGGTEYDTFTNSSTCWYRLNSCWGSDKVEVKKSSMPHLLSDSKVIDLISSCPYPACQDLNLIKDYSYLFTFDTFPDPLITGYTLNVNLNSKTIYSKNYSQYQIYRQNITFVATLTGSTSLCVEPVVVKFNTINIFKQNQYGPMIDNLTLINWPVTNNISNTTNSSTVTTNVPNITNGTVNISTNTTNTTNSTGNTTINTINGTTGNTSINTTNSINTINGTTVNTSIDTTNSSESTSSTSTTNSAESTSTSTTNSISGTGNSTIKYNNSVSKGQIDVFINFVSIQDQISNKFVLESDFAPSMFGLTPQYFDVCSIQIQGKVINTVYFSNNIKGCLKVTIIPNILYDRKSWKTIKVYFPKKTIYQASPYKFIITIDGSTINTLSELSPSQESAVNNASEIASTMIAGIKSAFFYINALSCSYFVINLIGFYNLSLMYLYLNVSTLPTFARIFLFNLAYIFFRRGSFTATIANLLGKEGLFDFSEFPLLEHVEEYIDDDLWFGTIDITSNYLQNNFESLILLGNIVLKFVLLKVVVRLFPKRIYEKANVSFSTFFQHFVGEISCFLPFFIIPYFVNLFHLGSDNFDGLANDAGHILTFSLFRGLTIAGFCLSFMQKQSEIAKKQTRTQKVIRPTKKAMMSHARSHSIIQYSHFLMNIFIPIFVTLFNRTVFFVVVTPIIVWRFYYTLANRKVYNLFENFIALMNKTVWLVYHFSFLLLYVLERLKLKASATSAEVVKIFGFVVIFCVLVGAIVDIVDVAYTIMHLVIRGLKIFFKKVYHLMQNIKIVSSTQFIEKQVSNNNKSKNILKSKSNKKINIKTPLNKSEKSKIAILNTDSEAINTYSVYSNRTLIKLKITQKSQRHIHPDKSKLDKIENSSSFKNSLRKLKKSKDKKNLVISFNDS